MLAPAQVSTDGIGCPSAKAGLVSAKAPAAPSSAASALPSSAAEEDEDEAEEDAVEEGEEEEEDAALLPAPPGLFELEEHAATKQRPEATHHPIPSGARRALTRRTTPADSDLYMPGRLVRGVPCVEGGAAAWASSGALTRECTRP